VQNLRRGHYELATEVRPRLRLSAAFTELGRAIWSALPPGPTLAPVTPDATEPGSRDPAFGVGGKVTTDFGAGGLDRANALTVQADGKLVAAGSPNNYFGFGSDFGLARYLVHWSARVLRIHLIGPASPVEDAPATRPACLSASPVSQVVIDRSAGDPLSV
jgi:hypothetical protein